MPSKFVVFEGPDGSGKTSLMRAFRKVTEFQYLEVDRLHLSRIVYSQWFRRDEYSNQRLRDQRDQEFLEFMEKNDAVVILLKAEPGVLDERLKARGENPADHPDAEAVSQIYEEVIDRLGYRDKVITMENGRGQSLHELAEQLAERLRPEKRERKITIKRKVGR